MRMRKVLLLTYHFPPSGAVAVYRMLGLARYLPRFGWQPIVVAPPRVPWEPEDVSLLEQIPAGTPAERVPFAQGFLGKCARYFAPEAHWLLKARPACERMIRRYQPDAIITSSPPGIVHLLGLWLKRRHQLPWLACFRDPWITNHPQLRPSLYQRYERWLESKVMRYADRLIANTPRNEAGWTEAYPNEAHKIVTIPNGFDPERFSQAPPQPPPLQGGAGGGKGQRLSMLHAGEFYSGRDPRPLLDALAAERLPIDVEFVGRKTEAIFDFTTEIANRGLQECVRQLGQIAYADALARMQRADILLLVHGPRCQVGVPAKLYEYLGAGRPILALAEPDSDIAWVLRESGVLHRIVSPTEVQGIRQALVELVRAAHDGTFVQPDPNALQQFTRERMAQRFGECLDGCVPARLNALCLVSS
jgi:glycosyltransferase involved in cell wall biosynthesis